MGAIMGAKTYYAVHELERFAGIDHDGPEMRRMYRNADGQEIFPFDPQKEFSFGKLAGLLRMKSQMKKLVKIMDTKYKGYDLYDFKKQEDCIRGLTEFLNIYGGKAYDDINESIEELRWHLINE